MAIWEHDKKANVLTEKERIIDMAASIIRNEIQTRVYNSSNTFQWKAQMMDVHLSLKVSADSWVALSNQSRPS